MFRLKKINLHVSISTFSRLEYEFKIKSIGRQELGIPKIGQNRNQVVSGKDDLTGKMSMFAGFVRNVSKKFEFFLWTSSKYY